MPMKFRKEKQRMRKWDNKHRKYFCILLMHPKISLLCFLGTIASCVTMPWGRESLLIISCHILFLKQECKHAPFLYCRAEGNDRPTDQPLKSALSVVFRAGSYLSQENWRWIFKPEAHGADRNLSLDFLFSWMYSWPIRHTLAQHDGSPATPS